MTGIIYFINLPLVIWEDEQTNYYISRCPILGISSCGDTEKKAETMLAKAILLFVNSCFRRGTLKQVLKDCGIKIKDQGTIRNARSPHSPRAFFLSFAE